MNTPYDYKQICTQILKLISEDQAKVLTLVDLFVISAMIVLMMVVIKTTSTAMEWFPGGETGRVMGVVWLLSTIITGIVYKSNLKAMLIIPKVVCCFYLVVMHQPLSC